MQQAEHARMFRLGKANCDCQVQADEMRLVLIVLHEGEDMTTPTAPGIVSVQVVEGHFGFHTGAIWRR